MTFAYSKDSSVEISASEFYEFIDEVYCGIVTCTLKQYKSSSCSNEDLKSTPPQQEYVSVEMVSTASMTTIPSEWKIIIKTDI